MYQRDSTTRSMLALISLGFLQPPKALDMLEEDIAFYGALVEEYLEDLRKEGGV